MPGLGVIVSRMRAAGESQDAIDAVRAEYERINQPKPDAAPAALTEAKNFLDKTKAYAPRQVSTEPEDFFGGFHKSLGTDAFENAEENALEWAKGAVVDLPANIGNFAKDVLDYQLNPGVTANRMMEGVKQIPGVVSRAGSDQKAFARMMGQLTGQPLVMEAAGAAALSPKTAGFVEGAGKFLSKAQPTSSPGNYPSPRMIGLRTVSRGVGAAGRGIQDLGERMRISANTRTPTKGAVPSAPPKEDLSQFAGGGQGITRPRITKTGTPPVDPSIDPFFVPPDTRPYEPPPPRPPGLAQESPLAAPVTPSTIPGEFNVENINLAEPIQTRSGGLSSRDLSMPYEPSSIIPSDPTLGPSGYGGDFDLGPAPMNKIPLRGGRPAKSSRHRDMPFDTSTGPQMQPSPAAGGRLTGNKIPTTEEQMASIIDELRQTDAKAPGVEAPPPPYSQGAGAPPEQPRVDVTKTRRTPKGEGEESPYSHLSLEQLEQILAERKAGGPGNIPPRPSAASTPPTSKFEPSVDPAKTAFSPEELELLRSVKPEDIEAALKVMAGEEPVARTAAGEVVDTTTGEITEPPAPRRAGKKMNAPNLKEAANKFAGDVEGSAEIPGWADAIAEWLTRKKPVNPLRPEVPKGQITNRKMFDLSAERGVENQLANEAQRFAGEVSPGGNEFSEDMLFTPEELGQPDIPEMVSPVENPFDERIAPGGIVSESPEIPMDDVRKNVANRSLDKLKEAMPKDPNELIRRYESNIASAERDLAAGRGEDYLPAYIKANQDLINKIETEMTSALGQAEQAIEPPEVPIKRSLFGDERGAVGPDINKSNPIKTVAQNSKKYQVTDPNGKRIGDITVDNEQIRQMKTVAKFKDVPDEKIAAVIYKTKLKRILDETGLGEGNVTITPISMEAKRAEAVKPTEKPAEPVTTSRLTKGGEVVAEKLSEPPPHPEPAKEKFPTVEERQAKVKGRLKTEDMPPIPESFAGTPAPSMKAESTKGYSASTTIETGKKAKTKVSPADVDAAFKSDGNTYTVRKAAAELEESNAPDTEYKNLMPETFQFELAKGETYKDRLARMIEAHRGGKAERARQAQPASEPVAAKPVEDKAARQERIDKFVAEVTGETPELRAKRLNKPTEPPPPVTPPRRIPKLRGPIPQGARITLKKVTPKSVQAIEDAGFVNTGRFDKDGNPIYVKSSRFSDKTNKAAQNFGDKN